MYHVCFFPSRNIVPTFLNTIYAHDPIAASFNFDPKTLKFANPLAVAYLSNPSKDLVDQIVESASRLTAEQVPDFVGLAATVLKAYKAREDNHKEAHDVSILALFLSHQTFSVLEN